MINKNHYHFIGIGGIGMSGVAFALREKGYSVSGSDKIINDQIKQLKKIGTKIFTEQNKSNIEFIINKFKLKNIIIVTSSAIKKNNEELAYCIQKDLPIKHRSEILSLIMNLYKSIGVAGSHGKTSTSTFISTLLDLCTKNSSAIIGGILPLYDSNSYIKNNKYLVVEIDESDGSNKKYKPELGIITNIDYDHCDYYSNLEELIESFKCFALNSKKLLINYDCKISKNKFNKDCYTWSVKEIDNVDFAMIPKKIDNECSIADYYENGIYKATINIVLPGLHNLSNITAAISACRINNISLENIIKKIEYLKLPKKRFEYKGDILGRRIIDDYAHHPNEIKATIELARLFLKDSNQSWKRIVIVFQPHRYSRVNNFLNEFIYELSKGDLIILTNIYSAGEVNIKNINSEFIAKEIYKKNKNVKYFNDNYEIKKEFFNITKRGDLILNMGAGNCHNLWSILV